MRFIVIHVTNDHYEGGGKPPKELVARVGAMMADLAKQGVLRGGEGLAASARGARLRREGGASSLTPGPLPGAVAAPAGFVGVRTATLDDAMARAATLAEAMSDVEVDVRPFTEPWDIGFGVKPPDLTTTRYMALYKPLDGAPLSADRRAARDRIVEGLRAAGELTVECELQTRGPVKPARLRKTMGRAAGLDGPFTEAKELIGGYVIVDVPARDDAVVIAQRYLDVVDTEQVDVIPLA